jgi:uncharacterized protein YbjT (DUF2867 family)
VLVLVIGATGGTGSLVTDRLLADDHDVRAAVRRPEQADDLAAGVQPVVADLEGDLGHAFEKVDAVMFCAGSGSQTGADATLRVDLHGAVRTIDAAVAHGVSRYVMLSSVAAGDPMQAPESMRHYLAAKHAADRLLLTSGLQATVVRPGGLTDDAGTGRVRLGVPSLADRGSIPRADVAATMVACLAFPNTIGATFEVVAGDDPIYDVLASVSA